MKKCKVTPSSNTKQKFFYLAPDAETLYMISRCDKKKLIQSLKSHPDVEIISLKPEQWLEIEWNGCQNIYDNSGRNFVKMNYVRMIKVTKLTSGDDSDSLISVHFGWMLSDQLRFTNYRNGGIRVKMLKPHDDQYNFLDLFHDNEILDNMMKKDESTMVC